MPDAVHSIVWSRRGAGVDDARARDIAQRLGTLSRGVAILKRDRRAWVVRVESPLGPLTVKAVTLGLWDRLRTRLGGTRFDRHWRSAGVLEGINVATPPPLLLGVGTSVGKRVQVLVLPFVEGRTLLDVIAGPRLGPSEASALAEALAGMLRTMESAGVYNRDHKPSNLLVSGAPGHPAVVLLDCVGLRAAGKRERWRGVDRMMASLVIEPAGVGKPAAHTDAMRVVRAYLAGVWRGDKRDDHETLHGVSRAMWMRGSVRALWREVAKRVREHGDPRPRVNPLAG